MYPVGFFRRPGSSNTGTTEDVDEGTGLTPEQIQLLTDLKTFRDTRPGVMDRPLLEHLNELVRSSEIQTAARTNPNPDYQLVNQGELFLAFSGKAEASVVSSVASTVEYLKPKFQMVGQVGSSMIDLPSYRIVPYTVYGIKGDGGFTGPGFTTNEFCVLRLGYPLQPQPFEFTVVNLSPNGKRLRIFCDTEPQLWDRQEYVTFRRGNEDNAIWSCAYIEPSRSMRLVFYPKSYQVFRRQKTNDIGAPLGTWVWVPGFVEHDEEADTARTLRPINNS